MPRIQGLKETGVLTNSGVIKAQEGYVFSVTLSWDGGAAGDKVYLLDATSDLSANPSTHEVVFVLDGAAGTITKEWPQGKKFDTGIYYKEGPNPTNYLELTYK